MGAAYLAHAIAADLWEFGRIVLILFGACCWNWLLWRGRSNSSASSLAGLLLIATDSVGAFCLFSFLNIQMKNIRSLAHFAPLWAGFSAASVASIVLFIAFVTRQQLGATKPDGSISILDVTQPTVSWWNPRTILIGLFAAVVCGVASVIWLWLIGRGVCVV